MESIGQLQSTGKPLRSFVELSRQIMDLAIQTMPRVEFLRGLTDLLLQFSGGDYLELSARGQVEYKVRSAPEGAVQSDPDERFTYEPLVSTDAIRSPTTTKLIAEVGLRQVVVDELEGRVDLSVPCFTPYGSFWTSDVQDILRQYSTANVKPLCISAVAGSLALIPFVIDENNAALLRLECVRSGAFSRDMIESYEVVVETVGLAMAERRARSALQERVKELGCLYSIARVVENASENPPEALERIAALLPPAWQYPEQAVARITLDGDTYQTADFETTASRQVSDIVVEGVRRGAVEMGYLEAVPHVVGTPFLDEEEHLIKAVARAVGEFVERRQAAVERSRLELQLRHADRLATIGQLAAGVAHEINEPLGGILGFAQLVLKDPEVKQSAVRDLNKIVSCCIQAREIVANLRLFARQTPIQEVRISIDRVVDEALSLVERRCVSEGIDLARTSAETPCHANADPLQLKQVLVNLFVNGIQAMPEGGTLTVTTNSGDSATTIVVRDTGTGIEEEIMSNIFDPFFTTKDVGEGTGLGLSVVHGIVAAHGGQIDVVSELGAGTTFTVTLPNVAESVGDTTQGMRH